MTSFLENLLIERVSHDDVTNETITIFVDMDGVLVNFEKGAKELIPAFNDKKLNRSRSLLTTDDRALKQELYDRIIATKGRYWRDLEPMPGAKQLWHYVNSVPNATVAVLTAPIWEDKECVRAKRDWVVKHLSPAPRAFFADKDKFKYVNKFNTDRSILIDDREDNCRSFIGAGGEAVQFTDVKTAIRQLETINILGELR